MGVGISITMSTVPLHGLKEIALDYILFIIPFLSKTYFYICEIKGIIIRIISSFLGILSFNAPL